MRLLSVAFVVLCGLACRGVAGLRAARLTHQQTLAHGTASSSGSELGNPTASCLIIVFETVCKQQAKCHWTDVGCRPKTEEQTAPTPQFDGDCSSLSGTGAANKLTCRNTEGCEWQDQDPVIKKGICKKSCDCGRYCDAEELTIKGNHKKDYQVYRIHADHWPSSEFSRNLEPTKKDNTMSVTTACAFDKLYEAAKADGKTIQISSGFRTLKRQEYFWNCYQTKKCNNGNLAANPAVKPSNHGRGLALDLTKMGGKKKPTADAAFCKTNGVNYAWMEQNAGKFGFVRTVRRECWHWEYRPDATPPDYQCEGTCPNYSTTAATTATSD